MKSVSLISIIAAAALAGSLAVQPVFAADTSAGPVKAAQPVRTAHLNINVVDVGSVPCFAGAAQHYLPGHRDVSVAYVRQGQGTLDVYAGERAGKCVPDGGSAQNTTE